MLAADAESGRSRWRRWNRALHRDAGYLVAGLTVIYAVSGVVVNHTEDWNPNYTVERVERRFAPIPVGERDLMVATLVERLGLPGPPKESFRPAPDRLELFYEDWNVKADAGAGVAIVERSRPRVLIRDMNTLHLNRLRGGWTYIADAYGVALAFLALSGLVMIKGRGGLLGRGKWFALAGLALPVLYLWWFDR